ncbi:MAG: hypothetical protein IJH76_03220 [Clostridia bacterium]|nr:hypothetical protein [Clostridia bacterium]
MKKDSLLKNTIINSLLGYPIGITLLMISYACIYLIAGEKVFNTEIMQLQNIKTLVLQLIIAGSVYYLFFLIVGIIAYFKDNKTMYDKYLVEHPFKSLLLMLLNALIIVVMCLLLQVKIFSVNLATINLIVFIIVFAIYGLWLCISYFIESNIIKMINQKLKERNK